MQRTHLLLASLLLMAGLPALSAAERVPTHWPTPANAGASPAPLATIPAAVRGAKGGDARRLTPPVSTVSAVAGAPRPVATTAERFSHATGPKGGLMGRHLSTIQWVQLRNAAVAAQPGCQACGG